MSKLTDIWIHLCLYTALFILSGLGREWDTTQYTPEWLTFVCGCYDNRHKIRSTGRVLLIFLTATPVFDFVFRAQLLGQGSDVTFSRLGHVDHSTARIVIRHPETSQLSFRTTDQGRRSDISDAAGFPDLEHYISLYHAAPCNETLYSNLCSPTEIYLLTRDSARTTRLESWACHHAYVRD